MSTHLAFDMQDATHGNTSGRPSWTLVLATLAAVVIGALTLYGVLFHGNGHGGEHADVAHAPHLWGVGILPFVGILAAIAFLPLIPATHHWWENNTSRFAVAMAFAVLTLIYLIAVEGFESIYVTLDHAILGEYIPFIVLLFSLYVISGGIRLTGDLQARPMTNTMFLGVGAALASFIGTTGASMLLIRPLLQTNSERKNTLHTVIFFIFLVSNIGGTLLPIGDPPLFLGYLKGVPFLWTMGLWVEWAFCSIALLVIYYFWDRRAYRREAISSIQRDIIERKPLRVTGWVNVALLLGVVFAVAILVPGREIGNLKVFPFMRELVMFALVGFSLLLTPKGTREANQFNYAAIIEVAALFIGIFIAMQVPVAVLNIHGSELGLSQPWHFFWSTGSLSSFLDNAPTYVVFFETANAMTHEGGDGVLQLQGGHFIREDLLVAISLGAVFMGAMTYIGNGPNFMVKSIAEQSGIRMPSFFGFMKYSVAVLVPLFIVVTILFLLK